MKIGKKKISDSIPVGDVGLAIWFMEGAFPLLPFLLASERLSKSMFKLPALLQVLPT
jgi:hypothetical protein